MSVKKCRLCFMMKEKCKKYEDDIKKLRLENENFRKRIAEYEEKEKKRMEMLILDLSEQRLKQKCNNMTKSHFLKGIKGIVEFIYTHILKNDDGLLCYYVVDKARSKYKYNTGKEIVNDVKFKNLAITIFPILHTKISEIYLECVEQYNNENIKEPIYKETEEDECCEKENSEEEIDKNIENYEEEEDNKGEDKEEDNKGEEDMLDTFLKLISVWKNTYMFKNKKFVAEMEYLFDEKNNI